MDRPHSSVSFTLCLGVPRPSALVLSLAWAGLVACDSPEAPPVDETVVPGESGAQGQPAPADDAAEDMLADLGPGSGGILPPERVLLGQAASETANDLPGLRRIGVLRVLVHQPLADAEPRGESPAAVDRRAIEAVAADLGLRVRYVLAPRRGDLLEALAKGQGDLVGDALPVEKRQGVAFAKPVRQTDRLVVAAASDKALKHPRDLRGRKLLNRPGDAELLRAGLGPKSRDLPTFIDSPAELDDEGLLAEVGQGKGLGLVYADSLAAYRAYADDVGTALPVAKAVPLAWAMPATSTELRASLDGFIYQRELLQHRAHGSAGDLDELKKRKLVRVAMLNNAASYFLYRGQEVGFQYELAQLLASRLDARLEVVVPEKPADMPRLLLEGRVDVVPLALAEADVPSGISVTAPFSHADLLLVQRAGEAPITSAEQLAGKAVHVRASSTYYGVLTALKAKVPGLVVVPASEDLETEELIDLVAKGKLPLTACNSMLLAVERTHRNDVQGTLVLAERQGLAYAVRSDAPKLLARLQRFVAEEPGKGPFRSIRARYFDNPARMAELHAEETATSGRISPYDDLVRAAAEKHGIDWRLILAQMYQESRFDPNAKSFAGAVGLMQIMPRTGKELGFSDLRNPEQNIQGGVKYLARLIDRFETELPMRQRVRFALASYNAGFEHVRDARLLAKKRGLDPNRWFNQVEQAMLLLEKPAYHRKARFGYCRGREPVAYVSRIQSKYEGFAALMPSFGPADQ